MPKKSHKKVSTVKDLLENIVNTSGSDFSNFLPVTNEDMTGVQHIPVHTLKQIKEKLGAKNEIVDADGNKMLQPLYDEEEKLKVIFGLLSERGLNILDYLENILNEQGFSEGLMMSINEAMGKTTEVLRDISEMQYKKAKLENERAYLEIQKYKADLKKREIEIKEQNNENNLSTRNNIIAVGSTSELMELINGNKSESDIKEVKKKASKEESEVEKDD